MLNSQSNAVDISLMDMDDDHMATRIIRVLNEALPGDRRNLEWFDWKHRSNPHGQSIVAIAIDSLSGGPIAVRTFWRVQLQLGLEPVLAFQPCDTATRPRFRRQGLFRELTRLALAEAEKQGGSLAFNFPNRSSAQGNRTMGWSDQGRLRLLMLPCRWWMVSKAIVSNRGRLGRFIDEVEEDSPTSEFRPPNDSLPWSSDILHGERGSTFLAWRFGKHPLHRYCELREGKGSVVGRFGKRSGLREFFIVAWLGSANTDVHVARECIRQVRDFYDPDLITTCLSAEHPLRPRATALGFLPTHVHYPLLARPLNTRSWYGAVRWGLEATDKDSF